MCFQGFVRFKCNCTALAQDTCEYAKELDVNFWLKVACPNYQTKRKVVNYCCSAQRYYCGKTPDGIALNRIHHQRDQAERDCNQAEHDYVQRFFPLYNDMAKMWQSKGGSKASFHAHPRVVKVCGLMQGAKSRRLVQLQRIADLDGIINAAKMANGKLPTSGMTGMSTHQRHAPGIANQPYMLTPELYHGQIAPHPMLMSQPFPQQPSSVQLGSSSQGRHLMHVSRPLTADAGDGLFRSDAVMEGPPISRMRKATQHHGKAQMAMKASSSPDKPSSVVRRSARVRDKRVNYAVDDDEVSSRSSSPQKSDVSTYSPCKSDISKSPVKSRNTLKKEPSSLHAALLRREGLTFENSINARKRRDSSIAPETKREAGSPVKKRKVGAGHGATATVDHTANPLASLYNSGSRPALAAYCVANPLRVVSNQQAFGTMGVGDFSGMYSGQQLLSPGHLEHTAHSLDEMEFLDYVSPLAQNELPDMEEPIK